MLKCFHCRREYDENTPIWKCECGSFLYHQFEKTPALEPRELANRPNSWWRYREALPLRDDRNMVTLGERATLLQSGTAGEAEVLFKLDGQCPTGSFKDRGSFMMVSKLKEWGVKEIAGDSSGNAGASVAAYSREAGIRAKIFAPAYTAKQKLDNIRQFGAELITVEGSREDTASRALQEAERTFYASHNWSPYFPAGVKTLAYELWEQMKFKAPDIVVVPVGGGSSLLGLYYGFRELATTGRIDHMPALWAVQSTSCAPLCEAFKQGAVDVKEVTKQPTIAEGIVIAKPVKGAAMLKALTDSGGDCLAVTDAEVEESLQELESQGIMVEPTSGIAPAGVKRAIRNGSISPEQKIVVLLTGKRKH